MSPLREPCIVLLSQFSSRPFCVFGRLLTSIKSVSSIGFSSKKPWKMDKPGFIDIGDYNIFVRSVSGLETTVVLNRMSDRLSVCFDMGIACRENQICDKVFVSHGHMDHISAVPQHVAKRSLFGMKMAKYYTPIHLTENLKKICRLFHEVNETSDALDKVEVTGVKPGDQVEIGKGCFVIPFQTFHRIPSQGYILYKRHKKLKEEYAGLSGQEIGEKVKSGEEVNHVETVPEVAYTGDTTFELFQNQECAPPADLFRVKLLIVEATYIDLESGRDMIQQARDRGHIHLYEIFRNADLFCNIDNILLIHFSDKYSGKYIQEQVYSNVPDSLKNKIVVPSKGKRRT